MRYRRVFLVNMSIPDSYLGPIRPPAGLGYVAQALEDRGIDYDVIDLLLGYSIKDLIERIKVYGPDLVGFSMFTLGHARAYRIIEQVKQEAGPFDVVVGGPHASTMREQVLEDCPAVDFSVVMEGEETLIDLCGEEPVEEIAGLIRRQGDEVVYGGDRKAIDLETLNFPRYKKFELDRYMLKEILLLSSRGCPYRCTYCSACLVVGRKVRMRKAGSVVDEIAYWYAKGYHRFNFGDDNFTFYGKRVYQFCDELQARDLKGLDLRCGNGIRADRVDRRLLERMYEVGRPCRP